jgi:hypothetical protein
MYLFSLGAKAKAEEKDRHTQFLKRVREERQQRKWMRMGTRERKTL